MAKTSALIQQGLVEGIFVSSFKDAVLEEMVPAEMASRMVEVPTKQAKQVQAGWKYSGEKFSAPDPVECEEVAPVEVDLHAEITRLSEQLAALVDRVDGMKGK